MSEENWTSRYMKRKYNRDQPRDPKGTPTGGRWTSGAGGISVIGTDKQRKRIGEILDSIPPHHIEKLGGISIEVVPSVKPSWSSEEQDPNRILAGWRPAENHIELRQGFADADLYHEIGHAMLSKMGLWGRAYWLENWQRNRSKITTINGQINDAEGFADSYDIRARNEGYRLDPDTRAIMDKLFEGDWP